MKFTPNPDFEFTGGTYTLEPKRMYNLKVIFSPQKVRRSSLDILVEIDDNPKSNFTITLTGDGFYEEILFEGAVEDDSDVNFASMIVGNESTSTFLVMNLSPNVVRYQFSNQIPNFKFSPKAGHIAPSSSKIISISFNSDKPTKLFGMKIPCTLR